MTHELVLPGDPDTADDHYLRSWYPNDASGGPSIELAATKPKPCSACKRMVSRPFIYRDGPYGAPIHPKCLGRWYASHKGRTWQLQVVKHYEHPAPARWFRGELWRIVTYPKVSRWTGHKAAGNLAATPGTDGPLVIIERDHPRATLSVPVAIWQEHSRPLCERDRKIYDGARGSTPRKMRRGGTR